MERAPTGVPGFDELVQGGFPRGRTMLVSGGTGVGKTTFAFQFLYNGALHFREPGVYVTLDERPNLIREDALNFGWDIRALEQERMIQIIDGTVARVGLPSREEFSLPATGFDIDKMLIEVMAGIRRIQAKRVGIDSIPAMGFSIDSVSEVRKGILKMAYLLERSGVTSILISEAEEENKFSKFGVEEYVADGVIVLHYMGVGAQSNMTLHIRKMRGTKHSEDLHPIEITSRGIVIHKIEEEMEHF